MIYRARVVADDPMREGIHLVIGLRGAEGSPSRVVVGIGPDDESTFGGPTIKDVPMGEQAPTLFLPDDIARPLLDALAQHYGGTGDTRTLRTDYEAERARVDRLIGVMIERRA